MALANQASVLEDVNQALSRVIQSFANSPTPSCLDSQLPALTEAACLLERIQGKQLDRKGRSEALALRRNMETFKALLHQYAEFHRGLAREGGLSTNGYSGFETSSDAWNNPTVIVES